MEESKTVSINLDKKSIEILRKVDSIHRDSMINIGLALVEKTGYYKTISGQGTGTLDDVASLGSLESLDLNTKVEAKKVEVKKSTQTWDNF